MPVYVFREGDSNIFKIGLTRDQDVSPRRRQLNSGSSAGLREFEVIHTDKPSELEGFLHSLLKHRNIKRHGGKEFFEMMSENHMREVLNLAGPMFQRSHFASKSVSSFEKLQCEGSIRKAKQTDLKLVSRLREIEKRLWEIEDEAVFLRFEMEMIECELKASIGDGPGIDGVATWESAVVRKFCLPLFQEREPDIYRRVLERFATLDISVWREQEPQLYQEITGRHPKLDVTSWRLQDSRLYKQMQTTYFTPTVTRKFVMLA
ncbi:MAG: GIY-YIG nuclease family protein [Acidobacteria bacterium]|nr:GIY-YIG nuclease family protein [Acidobacteriota bacterium]